MLSDGRGSFIREFENILDSGFFLNLQSVIFCLSFLSRTIEMKSEEQSQLYVQNGIEKQQRKMKMECQPSEGEKQNMHPQQLKQLARGNHRTNGSDKSSSVRPHQVVMGGG